MAVIKSSMTKQIVIAVGLGLAAIVVGLLLRKVSEGFQGTTATTTTSKPKGPPPNTELHKMLDQAFTASKCPNQQLRGQLHGMINALPAQKAKVKSDLTRMIGNAKFPECKALMQQLVTRPELG